MRGYGLNKHFTTNQDPKLLSFQRAPGGDRLFDRTPYLLSDGVNVFSWPQSFPHMSRQMVDEAAAGRCLLLCGTAGKAPPRPWGRGEGVEA